MSVRTFNPSSEHPARAVQAWLILIALAHARQTITYSTLSKLMYQHAAPGVLAPILGHIAFYCNQYNLPALTSLIVGQGRGIPGSGIPVTGNLDAEREKVYDFDWFDIYPPTEKQLADAYGAARLAKTA